jgi:hypothetical protein
MPSSLSQVVNSSKLVTTTRNKQCEHNLSTAYEQICNNLFAGLDVAILRRPFLGGIYGQQRKPCTVITKQPF